MATSSTRKLKNSTTKDFIIDPSEVILVTGANGYVGFAVVKKLLTYGYKNIRCLVRSASKSTGLTQLIKDNPATNITIVNGNLLSPADCQAAAKDATVVYHLAAGVEKSFAGCFLNSVVTTRNLLDALVAEKKLKRFVNTSSIAVYNNQGIARGGVLDENCEVDTHFVERHEAYTYGKAKQDALVMDYALKHQLPVVIVRPSVVFGPGKKKISDRIGTGTFGLFLHLGLNNRIPLTYIDNCAEAIVLAGLRPGIENQVFNIVDDDLPTSAEFLTAYKQMVKSFFSVPVPYPLWYGFCWLWEKYSRWSEGQLPPVFNPRTCMVYWKGNTYPNQKAKRLLGWQPKVPMREALEKFYAYAKSTEGKTG